MKRKKVLALVCAIAMAVATMPVNTMADTVQIYEKPEEPDGENPNVVTLSGNADVVFNGAFTDDEYLGGAYIYYSDVIRIDVEEAGIVSIHLTADNVAGMSCEDYVRFSLEKASGEEMLNGRQWCTNEVNGNWSTIGNTLGTFADGKAYLRWEEYLEVGSYILVLSSGNKRNYACRIGLYPFEVSDKMENLISSDYITTYTAGTGVFKGCILNNPLELNYLYGYHNYINVVIPNDGYYKVKFIKNGMAVNESELFEGISSTSKASHDSQEIRNTMINGIDNEWLKYFGGNEKTKYLEAGTYKVCIQGVAQAMLTYYTACYIMSIEEAVPPTTVAPTTKPPKNDEKETTGNIVGGNQNVANGANKPSQSLQNNSTNKNNNISTSKTNTKSKKKKVGNVSKVWFSKMTNKKLSIKWSKVSGAKGYQIRYSKKKNFKKKVKKKTISGKKRKIWLKMPDEGTTYYQVRAYKKVKSKKIYGNWSKKISVQVLSLSF